MRKWKEKEKRKGKDKPFVEKVVLVLIKVANSFIIHCGSKIMAITSFSSLSSSVSTKKKMRNRNKK